MSSFPLPKLENQIQLGSANTISAVRLGGRYTKQVIFRSYSFHTARMMKPPMGLVRSM